VTGVTYYEAWRTDKDGALGTAKYLGRFAKASSGNTTIRDGNEKIPGTFDVVGLASKPSHVQILHNGDMMSLPQPIQGIIQPLLLWQSLCPFSAVPHWCVVWTNCSSAPVDTLN
jgi:hypothetical protein